MPAATTQGFQVQARPGIDYLDPRLMTANLSGILPAARQGLGLYSDFQQIADQAKSRPLLEQLQQIQLRKAGQPIENIIGTGIEEVNRFSQIQSQDDDGNPIMEQPAGFDTFQTETVEVFDPVSGLKRLETRRAKPLQTMEQMEYQRAQMENLGTLSDNRGILSNAAMLRAQAVANRIANGKKISQGVNPQTGTLVVTLQNPDGSIEQVDTGQIPPPSQIEKAMAALGIGEIQEPAAQGIGVPPNIAAPASRGKPVFTVPGITPGVPLPAAAPADTPAVDADAEELIAGLSQAFEAEPAAPAYKSADEVKAAVGKTLTREQAIKILREQFGYK